MGGNSNASNSRRQAASIRGAVVTLVLGVCLSARADGFAPAIPQPDPATAGLTDAQLKLLAARPFLLQQLNQAYGRLVVETERVNALSVRRHEGRELEVALAGLAETQARMAAIRQYVLGQLGDAPAAAADAAASQPNGVTLVPVGPPPAASAPASATAGLTDAQVKLLNQHPILLEQLNQAYQKLVDATDRLNALSMHRRGRRELEVANAAVGETRTRMAVVRQYVLGQLAEPDKAAVKPAPVAAASRPDEAAQKQDEKLGELVKTADAKVKALRALAANRPAGEPGNPQFDIQELLAARNMLQRAMADRQAGKAADADIEKATTMLGEVLTRLAGGERE